MIVANELRKIYGGHDAVEGLTFRVPEGSAFALIGANGAGKTTTIKMLMDILQPSSGEAAVLGIDSRRLSAKEFQRIGYVSENQQLPLALTAGEYLDYLRPFYPRCTVEWRAVAVGVHNSFDTNDLSPGCWRRLPASASGGRDRRHIFPDLPA